MSSSSVKTKGGVNVNSLGHHLISIVVQQSCGLEVEAVKEPFGPRLGAPVPLAVR